MNRSWVVGYTVISEVRKSFDQFYLRVLVFIVGILGIDKLVEVRKLSHSTKSNENGASTNISGLLRHLDDVYLCMDTVCNARYSPSIIATS